MSKFCMLIMKFNRNTIFFYYGFNTATNLIPLIYVSNYTKYLNDEHLTCE